MGVARGGVDGDPANNLASYGVDEQTGQQGSVTEARERGITLLEQKEQEVDFLF